MYAGCPERSRKHQKPWSWSCKDLHTYWCVGARDYRSSGKAADAFNHWAICLALEYNILKRWPVSRLRHLASNLIAWVQSQDPHLGRKELTLPRCPLSSIECCKARTHHTHTYVNVIKNVKGFFNACISFAIEMFCSLWWYGYGCTCQ